MKKLCVGTVFTDASPLQKQWYKLQTNYLKKTTFDYDHVVFCSKNVNKKDFNKSHLIVKKHTKKRTSEHVLGLRSLAEYFRENKDNYENFLFIDSDAFPIRKNWQKIITSSIKDPHEIAICIRSENLEQRLHSSILFCKNIAIDKISFDISRDMFCDLCGYMENDVICKPYQTTEREKAFPLLRSNKFEIHPLLYGIYYDIFYHNCCGSGRSFHMRGKNYWSHMCDDPDVEKNITKLMNDPSGFINRLGWNPDLYASVYGKNTFI